jgi:hypothetical protein
MDMNTITQSTAFEKLRLLIICCLYWEQIKERDDQPGSMTYFVCVCVFIIQLQFPQNRIADDEERYSLQNTGNLLPTDTIHPA